MVTNRDAEKESSVVALRVCNGETGMDVPSTIMAFGFSSMLETTCV